jgi:flagellar motor protein MotB
MDDSSHLWAVSYADFLMVLLSFFVIFFSVDKSKRNDLLLKITTKITSAGAGTTAGAETAESSSRKPADASKAAATTEASKVLPTKALPKEIGATISSLFHGRMERLEVHDEKVVVNFPDDLFKRGEINLSGLEKDEFAKIIELIAPYSEQLTIGFIGHADAIRVKILKGRAFQNNLDFSVMRASRAMNLAVQLGLIESHVYASGAGNQVRESRSLSIVIKPYRGDVL